MGFFKKKDDGDVDPNRSALFAQPSKKSSGSSNPYAQPTQTADPYAQDNNKYANMGGPTPSAYQNARQQYGLPSGPGPNRSPAPPAASRSPAGRSPALNGSGYGAERYGSGGGYGANRYGDAQQDSTSRYGRGGYGGLGRSNSSDTTTTDDNRQALFGDAKDRYAQKSSLPPSNGQPGGGYSDEGTEGGYNYGEGRELTAEEQEEEDVRVTKDQIRDLKKKDVASTQNALRIAAQAEESGRATLARLGAQGERIHNTEKNLDLAANHNRIAEEKAKELKTLNRSMFAVHVSNPFTASSRRAERDQEILEKHQAERDQRAETREAAYQQSSRMEQSFKNIQGNGYKPQNKASLAERSKYQFEADSEDEEMENEIDSNLDALGRATGNLHRLARAVGEEVDEQNKHIDKITQKVCQLVICRIMLMTCEQSDRVDDQIAMNRARLDRIH